MNSATLIQKLWNYCNGPQLGRSLAGSSARKRAGAPEKSRLALRDDGMSYGDYVEHLTYLPCSPGRFTSRPLRGYEPSLQRGGPRCLEMAEERRGRSYHQPRPIPDAYAWPALLAKDGDALFVHYRHTLEELGGQPGMLALIFGSSRPCAENAA